MKMKEFIVLMITFCIVVGAHGQSPEEYSSLQSKMVSLRDSGRLEEAIEVSKELKTLVDFEYYMLWYKFIPTITNDKMRRARLIHLQSIPWFTFRERPYTNEKGYTVTQSDMARKVYLESTFELIKEYAKWSDDPELNAYNVEILKYIKVSEAYQFKVYPCIKKAIEHLGGTWDKGPLPTIVTPTGGEGTGFCNLRFE